MGWTFPLHASIRAQPETILGQDSPATEPLGAGPMDEARELHTMLNPLRGRPLRTARRLPARTPREFDAPPTPRFTRRPLATTFANQARLHDTLARLITVVSEIG
jgi:hypothetical protein